MNRSHRLPLFAGGFFALVILAGCINLKPKPDPTRFYRLSPSSVPQMVEATPMGVSLGLRRVRVPDYLQDMPLAVAVSVHEIRYQDRPRWAEPLETGIARTVSEHLRRSPLTREVHTPPWPVRTTVDYEIGLTVLRFEGNQDGTVQAEIGWVLVRPGERLPLEVGRYVPPPLTWTPDHYEELVEALSQVLQGLAQNLLQWVDRHQAGS